jgi:hypothetical protein
MGPPGPGGLPYSRGTAWEITFTCGLGDPAAEGLYQMQNELAQWLKWHQARDDSNDPGFSRRMAEHYRQLVGQSLKSFGAVKMFSLTSSRVYITMTIPAATETDHGVVPVTASMAVRDVERLAAWLLYEHRGTRMQDSVALPPPVWMAVRMVRGRLGKEPASQL